MAGSVVESDLQLGRARLVGSYDRGRLSELAAEAHLADPALLTESRTAIGELMEMLGLRIDPEPVDLRWIRQNGTTHVEADGLTMAVGLALTGHFFRGYDNARTDLGMDLRYDPKATGEHRHRTTPAD